jgi:uncharacterized protein (TIGR03435 family)
MTRAVIVYAFVSGAAVGLTAQATPQPDTLAFEVASVKPNTSGDDRSFYRMPPQGQIAITNGDLRRIIAQAYDIDPRRERYLLIGGPPELLAERFDITAKPPDDAPPGQSRLMLQALLVDRFRLRIRRERRELPVYELQTGRSDREFGPRLRPSSHICGIGGASAPPREVCTVEFLRSDTEKNVLGTAMLMVGQGIKNAGPFSWLVDDIQAFLDRPIVDATGISGNYEWHLSATNPGIVSADVPSIATAVQEQLGLKLEAARAPVEVLVIDSVERPTPD